ncbi:MMPL family transporter [uncultured Umboniibacter sp.]|uniref:efflux RND transporter permease subunit n=1 Tax=uncultured Umboniibacter sp. TaxID=1798917 RepID=UPI00262CFB80|nr:MMPL family transporter [uncultured Umboniibacter sp.]
MIDDAFAVHTAPKFFTRWMSLRLLIISLFVGLLGAAIWQIPNARLDASSDSLTLETDPGLALYRSVSTRYRSGDFFVLAFRAHDGDALSNASLNTLEALQEDLAQIDGVESVMSVLNVPLLQSPPVGLESLSSDARTLLNAEVDIEMARAEFHESPVYRDTLLSEDNATTALLISLPVDTDYYALVDQRNELLGEPESANADGALEIAQAQLLAYRSQQQDITKERLAQLRSVVAKYERNADIFIGGVPMIASDMLDFIRRDIQVFGLASLALMIAALALFFRNWRWVAIPLTMSASVVILMSGWLATIDWRLSVISSNFASLLLIISLAIGIHLSVRFRELRALSDAPLNDVLWSSLQSMWKPCFYSVLTTLVAFLSLVVSGIRPVIDFGQIMAMGITLSLILTFALFPLLVALTRPTAEAERTSLTSKVLASWGQLSLNRGKQIFAVSLLLLVGASYGVTQVKVENRFIDYFAKDTEIYQGMALIDRELGGTTPLEIVVSAPDLSESENLGSAESFDGFDDGFGSDPQAETASSSEKGFAGGFDDEFGGGFDDEFGGGFDDEFGGGSDDEFGGGFDDEFGGGFDDEFGGDATTASWWFSTSGVNELRKLHEYIDGLEASGKVMSLVTTIDVAEGLNKGPLDDFTLAFLQTVMPEDIAAQVVRPYWHEATDEARIEVRVVDSTPGLSRQAYVEDIVAFANQKAGLAGRVEATGMLVLYNNMVQSLFSSQIETLGAVFVGIFLMFWLLFRRLGLALVAIIPNLLAAVCIVGFMGVAGLPLDFMTITIAAIVVGIGVDDCIHYVIRYQHELAIDHDKRAALTRAHHTIGSAMSYTSWTVVLGFAVLALSKFTPSVVFGLLTASAMVLALTGALILLPRLLLLLPLSQLLPAGKQG